MRPPLVHLSQLKLNTRNCVYISLRGGRKQATVLRVWQKRVSARTHTTQAAAATQLALPRSVTPARRRSCAPRAWRTRASETHRHPPTCRCATSAPVARVRKERAGAVCACMAVRSRGVNAPRLRQRRSRCNGAATLARSSCCPARSSQQAQSSPGTHLHHTPQPRASTYRIAARARSSGCGSAWTQLLQRDAAYPRRTALRKRQCTSSVGACLSRVSGKRVRRGRAHASAQQSACLVRPARRRCRSRTTLAGLLACYDAPPARWRGLASPQADGAGLCSTRRVFAHTLPRSCCTDWRALCACRQL